MRPLTLPDQGFLLAHSRRPPLPVGLGLPPIGTQESDSSSPSTPSLPEPESHTAVSLPAG